MVRSTSLWCPSHAAAAAPVAKKKIRNRFFCFFLPCGSYNENDRSFAANGTTGAVVDVRCKRDYTTAKFVHAGDDRVGHAVAMASPSYEKYLPSFEGSPVGPLRGSVAAKRFALLMGRPNLEIDTVKFCVLITFPGGIRVALRALQDGVLLLGAIAVRAVLQLCGICGFYLTGGKLLRRHYHSNNRKDE